MGCARRGLYPGRPLARSGAVALAYRGIEAALGALPHVDVARAERGRVVKLRDRFLDVPAHVRFFIARGARTRTTAAAHQTATGTRARVAGRRPHPWSVIVTKRMPGNPVCTSVTSPNFLNSASTSARGVLLCTPPTCRGWKPQSQLGAGVWCSGWRASDVLECSVSLARHGTASAHGWGGRQRRRGGNGTHEKLDHCVPVGGNGGGAPSQLRETREESTGSNTRAARQALAAESSRAWTRFQCWCQQLKFLEKEHAKKQ